MNTKTTNAFLDELRCVVCKNFGSFPISVCADGRIICGKCEQEGDNMFPLTKVPLLETLLKGKTFPCKNEKSGCEEELVFDFINEHESKCTYRTCSCMIRDCNWKGLQVDLHKHAFVKHKTFIHINDVQLPRFLHKKMEDVILVCIQGALFIIEYEYDAGAFLYRLSYVSSHIKQALYSIYKDGDTKLVDGECFPYDNPISLRKSNHEISEMKDDSNSLITIKLLPTKYDSYIIDHVLISSYKCLKCLGYLIPCAYDLQPFGNVCGICVTEKKAKATISTRPVLTENMQTMNFPCCWKFCNYVSKPYKMFDHQTICRFRINECLVEERCGSMDIEDMKEHLRSDHNGTYFEDKYRMTEPAACRIFTLKYNTFILVTVDTVDPNTVSVVVKTTGLNNRIPVYVSCEHEHCNISSRVFCIVNEISLTKEQLPPCFKLYKKFSLTFKIF